MELSSAHACTTGPGQTFIVRPPVMDFIVMKEALHSSSESGLGLSLTDWTQSWYINPSKRERKRKDHTVLPGVLCLLGAVAAGIS